MGNKKRHRNERKSPQDSSISAGSQEYDLTQSFKKVRQYSRSTKRSNYALGVTSSDEGRKSQGWNDVVTNDSAQYDNKPTDTFDWSRYDRLEDKFTSFSNKNEEDHTALRQELEGKIDKSSKEIRDDFKDLSRKIDEKLPKQWYTWTVGGIVAMVGLIWVLSYQDVAKMPSKIDKIENRIEQIESELTKPKQADSIYTMNNESNKIVK